MSFFVHFSQKIDIQALGMALEYMRQTLVEPELRHLANIFMSSQLPPLTISIYNTSVCRTNRRRQYIGVKVTIQIAQNTRSTILHYAIRRKKHFNRYILKPLRKLYHHLRKQMDSLESDSSETEINVGIPYAHIGAEDDSGVE